MENQNEFQQSPFNGNKINLPNATAVLVLGICSIIFTCFYVGLILGIIGMVLGSKAKQQYRQNPSLYDNYGQLNAGYIMSIIGTVLGVLYILYIIVILVFVGGTIGWGNIFSR